MAEPLEVRVAGPEIAGVNEVVLVGADPQLLRSGTGLDFLERGDNAGLEDVEPGGDMKPGDVDGAAEIMASAEGVRRRVADDFVEERLPDCEVRVARQRQTQPIRRIDKGRAIVACGVEPRVAISG